MSKVLRWYINRIYRDQITDDGSPYIEVTISPGKPKRNVLSEMLNEEGLISIKSDDLDWWFVDEKDQLEGWTSEKNLLIVLKEKNVFIDSPKFRLNEEEREIKEDMVLLQFVKNQDALDTVWNDLKASKSFPKLFRLIDIDEAQWFDFTRQARKLSSDLYQKVLGEKREVKDESKR
jgi:hypothetical protein